LGKMVAQASACADKLQLVPIAYLNVARGRAIHPPLLSYTTAEAPARLQL